MAKPQHLSGPAPGVVTAVNLALYGGFVPDWEMVKALGAELPDVTVDRWYGTPALKVAGKGFARLREDGVLAVMIDVLEREALMQEDPETFYITPHYQDYPAMLINLQRVDPEELRELLIESWCSKAPKRLRKAFDEEWEAGNA